jgi:hypothetical protein
MGHTRAHRLDRVVAVFGERQNFYFEGRIGLDLYQNIREQRDTNLRLSAGFQHVAGTRMRVDVQLPVNRTAAKNTLAAEGKNIRSDLPRNALRTTDHDRRDGGTRGESKNQRPPNPKLTASDYLFGALQGPRSVSPCFR